MSKLTKKSSQKNYRKLIIYGLSFLMVCGGVYLLTIIRSPIEAPSPEATTKTIEELTKTRPIIQGERLYIPKLGVDLPISTSQSESDSDELAVMADNVLNRKPQNGNPRDGGNYVLAAHRLELGWTPEQTRAKSPLYNIDKLEVGDEMFVDYGGVRYRYKVSEYRQVAPTALEIENRTGMPQITLYSCDLAGYDAGREVVIAKPAGTVDI
ncbi:sortase [Candidatus Saccharibacteria bacterium]|jgi:LPXTG-site transpeptidase (sortase) family protein|nr:sortase [Candidatus Saccharibacteria bacterium]